MKAFVERVPRELRILFLFLAATLVIWGTVGLLAFISSEDLRELDRAVIRSFRNAGDPAITVGPVWLTQTAIDITVLGGRTVLTLWVLAVALYLFLRRQVMLGLLVISATATNAIALWVLKEIIDRPRPSIVPHLVVVHDPSFPSGHAMSAAVVYLTLAGLVARTERSRSTKAYTLGLGLLLTFLVGTSRVFLGVHYPSDVLAGWTVGALWAMGWASLGRRLQRGQS